MIQIQDEKFEELLVLLERARDHLQDAASRGPELGQEAYAVVSAELSEMLDSLKP